MTKDQGPTTTPTLRVGVVGCGRMGRLHARVYGELPGAELAAVHDRDEASGRRAAETYGGRHYPDLDAMAGEVDAVTISVPTSHHRAAAEPFLRRGIACLIEKPLAATPDEARAIADFAEEHKAIVQVGHIERFNPVILALQKMAISPRFIEVIRVSPMSFRSVDVGVVLDMMIHDIDIVLALAGGAVEAVEATGVPVLVEGVEDVCNARLRFDNGCVATLTASRLALKTERKLRVFSPEAYVSLDYHKRAGVFVKKGQNVEKLREIVARVRAGETIDPGEVDYGELVEVEQLQIEEAEPLRAQLESFLAAARREAPPAVTARDGFRAVETARRIVEAMPPVPL